jgi:putative transcriptional regulator
MQKSTGYLAGQILVAMPQMEDPRFSRAVVYLCAHSAEGAMGIVVNRLMDGLTFPQLLTQLDIPSTPLCDQIRIHFGGPVDVGRGFVLHSDDYLRDTTMRVSDGVALTATVDVLRAIADGTGPNRSLLALGYAGWGAGQLDDEIRDNAWLTVPADPELLFSPELDRKYDRAVHKLGFDVGGLSAESGHA